MKAQKILLCLYTVCSICVYVSSGYHCKLALIVTNMLQEIGSCFFPCWHAMLTDGTWHWSDPESDKNWSTKAFDHDCLQHSSRQGAGRIDRSVIHLSSNLITDHSISTLRERMWLQSILDHLEAPCSFSLLDSSHKGLRGVHLENYKASASLVLTSCLPEQSSLPLAYQKKSPKNGLTVFWEQNGNIRSLQIQIEMTRGQLIYADNRDQNQFYHSIRWIICDFWETARARAGVGNRHQMSSKC